LLLLLISTFYLLASIPFSYYHFLQFPHFWWMPLFIGWHPLLLVAAVALLLLTTRDAPFALRVWMRRLMIATVTLAACMTAILWMPALQSYQLSGVLVFAPLGLLIGANVVDLAATGDRWVGIIARTDSKRTVVAATLAGLGVSTVYVGSALIDRVADTLQPAEIGTAIGMSIGSHVALFTIVAGMIVGTGAFARRLVRAPAGEAVAVSVLLAALVAIAVRRVVLIAIDFEDWRAVMVACAVGVAMVTGWMTVRIRHRANGSRAVRVAAGIACVCVAVLVVPPLLRLADWDATLQKSVAMATWVIVVGLMAAIPAGGRVGWLIAALLVATAATSSAIGVTVARAHATQQAAPRAVNVTLAMQRYATFDTSMRALLDLARPTVTSRKFLFALGPIGALTENSATQAVALPLVDRPLLAPVSPPDIFMLVVDSMRPDYLSAYNGAATFTPAIGAFAEDSIVMRRAFTPYAGTGLSEPAMWVGGLVPRLMYPKPFAPINNLDRLLHAGRYLRYVSIDEILDRTLEDRTGLVRLDSHLAHPERLDEQFKFDLCQTLPELAGRLEHDRPREPVFFFTQAQNLHIRLLTGDKPRFWTRREDADQFFAPAVTALRRIDGCFGSFIERLKAMGRYDNSVIVLTADHGDAYGEEGRWGHAFYVAPEILRIPLIVHVPEALRRDQHWSPDAVAWSTDITPTLYELLGQTGATRGTLVGRPLFTRDGEAAAPPRERYLVQSSYSKIFGIVDADANWLFTADGGRLREEFFDLRTTGSVPQPLVDADRLRLERWLMEEIDAFNAHYEIQR
jgi:hypothetical protein